MRILFTANGSPWTRNRGGGTLAVHSLAEALTELGHEVTVLYARCPNDPPPPQLIYKSEWAHFYQVATVNLNIFSFRKKLRELIQSGKFDVVHGNAEEAFFAPMICRKAGIPFCYTSHANSLPPVGPFKGMLRPIRFLKSVNSFLERETARRADLVFTFSCYSRNLVDAALGKKGAPRIQVVKPGIDSRWIVSRRPVATKRQVLFWGRMAEQKGVRDLLHAFKIVQNKMPDATLVLVGDGSCRSDYEKLADSLAILDKVQFLGWLSVEKISQLSTESMAAAFPSQIESFGLAVAEAMATGLPVVTTRVGALPEIIDEGRTGKLVETGDIEMLAESLISILGNPSSFERWGENARQFASESFKWENTAKETADAYGKLLNRF